MDLCIKNDEICIQFQLYGGDVDGWVPPREHFQTFPRSLLSVYQVRLDPAFCIQKTVDLFIENDGLLLKMMDFYTDLHGRGLVAYHAGIYARARRSGQFSVQP